MKQKSQGVDCMSICRTGYSRLTQNAVVEIRLPIELRSSKFQYLKRKLHQKYACSKPAHAHPMKREMKRKHS